MVSVYKFIDCKVFLCGISRHRRAGQIAHVVIIDLISRNGISISVFRRILAPFAAFIREHGRIAGFQFDESIFHIAAEAGEGSFTVLVCLFGLD